MRNLKEGLFRMYRLAGNQKPFLLILIFLVCFSPFLEVFGISLIFPLITLATGQKISDVDLPGQLKYFVSIENIQFNNLAFTILFIALLKILISLLLVYLRSKIAVNLRAIWTEKIIYSAIYGKFKNLNKNRVGSYIETISSETRKAANSIITSVKIIERLLLFVFLFSVLALSNPIPTLILITILFSIVFLLKKFGVFKSYSRGEDLQRYSQSITLNSVEILNNIRLIKIYNYYKSALIKIKKSLNNYSRERLLYEVSNKIPNIILESGLIIIVILTLIFLYNKGQGNILKAIPNLSLILVLAARISSILGNLSKAIIDCNIGLANINSVYNTITSKNDLEDTQNGKTLKRISHQIEFVKLSFGWSKKSPLILNQVNINFYKGINLIIGPSGSGKSTIASLLMGLIKPESGEIKIDGFSYDSFSLKSIRENIGFVTQEDEFIYGSFLDNLKIAAQYASFDDLVRACKLANAHNFIENTPYGYNTLVEENGSSLSGGQRQRLSLARALINKKSVYIFDEVTNALSKEDEILVQDTIKKISSESIVIQISHLSSSINYADIVYKINKNGIVTTVKHD
tara:strand:+ start:2642 stop:4369 length:1728 start_codon:yes stop_codon:yes gene_type:complete